ncbi:MAG: hypothetical protein GX605_07115 [Chloroflexi bacterium]|nr:hypothetical protein [Chloroflexota bacterium]
MSKKLDPEKVLYLKPNQRTVPGRKRRKAQGSAGEWVEHSGDVALDEWGVAIRVMRKLGKSF